MISSASIKYFNNNCFTYPCKTNPKMSNNYNISQNYSQNALTNDLYYKEKVNKAAINFTGMTAIEKKLILDAINPYLKSLKSGELIDPSMLDKLLTKMVGEKNVIRNIKFYPKNNITKGRIIKYIMPDTGREIALETHDWIGGPTKKIETRIYDVREIFDLNGIDKRKLNPKTGMLEPRCVDQEKKRDFLYCCENGDYTFKTKVFKDLNAHLNSGDIGEKWIDSFSKELTQAVV